MATNNPRGFVPSRHLSGRIDFAHNQYRVSANNPKAIFIGDAVELFSDGKVRVIDASAATANERAVLGVVRSVYDSNARPKTHSLPGTGQFIDGSTAGYVDVVDDPDVIFLVSTDATADQSMVGSFVNVTAKAPVSSNGISGMHLKLSTVAVSAQAGLRFQIMGVAPNETATGGIGDGGFSLNQDLEVRISKHMWRRGGARISAEA